LRYAELLADNALKLAASAQCSDLPDGVIGEDGVAVADALRLPITRDLVV
jgi:hypothetical protein